VSLDAWSELITPANPAAGAIFTRRVPGETYERYLSIEAKFVTSAAVANRLPFVAYTNGDGVETYRAIGGAVLAAGTTLTMTWSQELDTNAPASAGFMAGPLRDVDLPPGWHVVVGLTNIDAADQISLIQLWTRRTPTGPMQYAAGAHAFDPGEQGW
jgi:hypothetical protein